MEDPAGSGGLTLSSGGLNAAEQGTSAPLGATVETGGVNFSVYSKNATLLELLLFDDADALEPSRTIPLDPRAHRTYHYWHAFIPDLKAGQLYGFRASGPFAPERGLRFDSSKALLDPYAKAVAVPKRYQRHSSGGLAMKSIVADPRAYDWEALSAQASPSKP